MTVLPKDPFSPEGVVEGSTGTEPTVPPDSEMSSGTDIPFLFSGL